MPEDDIRVWRKSWKNSNSAPKTPLRSTHGATENPNRGPEPPAHIRHNGPIITNHRFSAEGTIRVKKLRNSRENGSRGFAKPKKMPNRSKKAGRKNSPIAKNHEKTSTFRPARKKTRRENREEFVTLASSSDDYYLRLYCLHQKVV